jgi:hypothetical protein
VIDIKKTGKGQNVKNHFVESQKKNIESLKVDQNIESIFKVDQNVESDKNHQLDQNVKNQNVEKTVESQKLSKNTFNALKFFDAIGNIRTSKVFWATTYGVLPMCTKACGGLG